MKPQPTILFLIVILLYSGIHAQESEPELIPAINEIHIYEKTDSESRDLYTEIRKDSATKDENLSPFIGKPLKFSTLAKIQSAITTSLHESEEGLVRVLIPEQDITEGIITFEFVRATLGQVRAVGNKHFKDQIYTQSIRLKKGEQIYTKEILKDIDWLTRNTFRRVSALYKPGDEFGEIDLDLTIVDRRPWTVFGGFDQEGTDLLGINRYHFGLQHGNFLGLDHRLTYQYFTDSEFEDQHGHFASYLIPLPWQHELTFSGFYVNTGVEFDSGIPGVFFESTGESWQGSSDYVIPFPRIKKLKSDLIFGFDFKSTNSNLDFGELEVFDTNIEVLQFRAGWRGRLPDDFGVSAFSIQGVWSPGDLTNHNTDDIFSQSRAFAEADYFYGKLNLDRRWYLPAGFALRTDVEAQASNGNLLASEQFILSGDGAVRGYERSLLRGDEGLVTNVQLVAPPLILSKEYPSLIRPFGFWDHGWGRSVELLPDEPDDFSLQSAGIGFEGTIYERLQFNAAYGWQLGETGFDDGEDGRWHIGVSARF